MSRFCNVPEIAPIEVFNVSRLAKADTHPKKVNLGVGAYRTDDDKPWVLPVVREAEKRLAADESLNHEYFPILGSEEFSGEATKLLLGEGHAAIKDGRAFGVQSLSGTGSLTNGAVFLAKVMGYTTVSISKPTWGNHAMVFPDAGLKDMKPYTYWSQEKRAIDFDGYLRDINALPENAVLLLHGCAHNPTGSDPTKEQWGKILEVVKSKKLFPFFDIAYQGFASGDPDADAWAVRFFADQGVELFCAQSFAKNFGLYNERVGNLTVVVKDTSKIPAIKSQFSRLVRANYSNPPAHGARVVTMVLKDPAMKAQWFENIKTMSGRIKDMRKQLRERLETLKTPGTWSHITEQIGMFSFTGLYLSIIYRFENIKTMSGRIKDMRKQLRERLETLKTPGTWSHITEQIGMFSFTGLYLSIIYRFENIKTMSGRIKDMRKQLRERLETLKTPGTWSHITEQIGMFSFTGLYLSIIYRFENIKTMSGRIKDMRKQLRERLETLKTPGTWSHITEQIGMFSFTGLSPEQCELMTSKHHVYLLRNGRVSMCGVTSKNVDHVAHAIHDVVTSLPANH